MNKKIQALATLRDQIKKGRVNPNKQEHQRQYFLDVDGEKVYITEPRALEAIDARIAAEEPA